MQNTNEVTVAAARVLQDLAAASGMQWEHAYFRFHSENIGHRSFEFMHRVGRNLQPLMDDEQHTNQLDKLMMRLFEIAQSESGERPVVAVLALDSGQNYSLKYEYKDPRALEIGYMALGTANSYFSVGEVDIPDYVKEYQAELAEKGVEEIPIPFVDR